MNKKRRIVILVGILVIIVLVVGGWFLFSSNLVNFMGKAIFGEEEVEKVLFVCPDGTEVVEESQCPQTGDLFENIIFAPSSLSIETTPGETGEGMLEITNNNEIDLFFRCGIFGLRTSDDYAPNLKCSKIDENETSIKTIKIPAGERDVFTISVGTHKNAYFTDENGTKSFLTTKKGDYFTSAYIDVSEKSNKFDQRKELLLSVTIV